MQNAIKILKLTSFAIAFLLYSISRKAYTRNQSLRALVKIIQVSSLPPPLEICEFKFEVNNEQHDFLVHLFSILALHEAV